MVVKSMICEGTHLPKLGLFYFPDYIGIGWERLALDSGKTGIDGGKSTTV